MRHSTDIMKGVNLPVPYATLIFFTLQFCSGIKTETDGHTSRIFACAFNPKSHHELISGGWDDMVMCWDDRQPYATRYFTGVHLCGEGLDFDKPGKMVSRKMKSWRQSCEKSP